MKENKRPIIAITAIILNEDKDKILLIKRGGKACHGMWSLVSGKVDWGEEIKETVIREVKEETGLDIEVSKYVGKYYDKRGRHPTKTKISLPHVCRVIGGEVRAGSDALDAKWFSLEEVKKMEIAFDHKESLIDEGLI